MSADSYKPIRSGVRPVETWTRGYAKSELFNYVDISSVDRESKTATFTRIPVSDAPSRARQILQTNDVLVSTVRPNLNAVALASEDLNGAIASTGFTVLRAKPDKLNPRFLFHWVRSPGFISEMIKRATGASYPAVSDRIVLESRMPMPSLPEQRRIADILDKADAIRRKRKEAIALTEQLLCSTFLEMFGDPVTNPKGWEVKPLGELINKERGISYGIVQRGPEIENGVPVVRISNIRDNYFDDRRIVKTSKSISSAYQRTILRGGELLISIRGTVGRVAIAPDHTTNWNVSREIAVIPLLTEISRDLVHHALLTPGLQRFILGNVKGIAQSGINLSDLRLAPIPLPPHRITRDFETITRTNTALDKDLTKSLSMIENLAQSLIVQFFSTAP